MTADIAARRANAPATGLFGGGRTAQESTASRGEASATQRKAFPQLFRADGSELHAA